MKRRLLIVLEALFATALLAGFYVYSRQPSPDQTTVVNTSARAGAASAVISVGAAEATVVDETTQAPEIIPQYGEDLPLTLDSRTKTTQCVAAGSLPDHACTPGAALDFTVDQICNLASTKSIRNVPVKLKKSVYAEYGLGYPQPTGAFEVDHLIPLEIAGSNDIANLFPEAASPAPGFHEKDLVENYLREEVCSGRRGLAQAQMEIANNWLAIYESLAADQIQRLKDEASSRYSH